MTSFDDRVERIVRRIPRGRVASYSMVADRIGKPGAARAVGNALSRGLGGPAHRVVTADGRLAPHWPEQSSRLRDEGVEVVGGKVVRPIPWWRA